jgi:hypothetical protein
VLVRRAILALGERRALARLPLRVVARQRATPPSNAPASICASMNSTAAPIPSLTAQATRACWVMGKVAADVLEERVSGFAK